MSIISFGKQFRREEIVEYHSNSPDFLRHKLRAKPKSFQPPEKLVPARSRKAHRPGPDTARECGRRTPVKSVCKHGESLDRQTAPTGGSRLLMPSKGKAAHAGTFAALFDLRIGEIDMDAQMDEARIERIARAMCRAARRNPDERLLALDEGRVGFPTAFSALNATVPAWMQFRESAERFVSTHAVAAERL